MFCFFVFGTVLLISQSTAHIDKASCNVSTFPPHFKFGAGSSAYQIEGGWNEDGKSRSWWDWFMNTYPQYSNNATGNVACDSYHKYKEDVAAINKIGLDYYRFSLSWTRLLPKGFDDEVNQAGVDYYNNLLDELKAAKIEPLVTIYHWDTPLTLEYLGNWWSSPKMVDYFEAFADLAFRLFGDRVKLWATVNEPKSVCQLVPDTLVSIFEEMPVGTIEYLCGHHMLLAHAKAYRLYQRKYRRTQKGRISLSLNFGYDIPLTNSTEDKEATRRENEFDFGWFAHPLVYGDYPELMKKVIARNSARQNFTYSRLPRFTPEQKKLVKGSYDLIFLNSYTASLVTTANYSNVPLWTNDEQTTTSASSDWPTTISGNTVYPQQIRGVLKYIKDTYNNPEILITENGYADAGGLNDTARIDFIRDTLQQIRLAMCWDGVNVSGYIYWSLLDSLEWNLGYTPKFGLVQVDFDSTNLNRTLKESAYYYKNLIESHYLNSSSSQE